MKITTIQLITITLLLANLIISITTQTTLDKQITNFKKGLEIGQCAEQIRTRDGYNPSFEESVIHCLEQQKSQKK